jgi:UDP:flavonoid glycosyltransferase YjiC (YdhE family)
VRVLMTVNDAYGHVLPLAGTARELIARGHDVVMACPGGTPGSIGLDGAQLWRYRPDGPPLPDPSPADRPDEAYSWAIRVGWPHRARSWVRPLLADATAFRPDVVVCEPMEHAGRVVAAALDVPLIDHGWGFTVPAGTGPAAAGGLADLYASVGADAGEPDLRVDLGPADVQEPSATSGVSRYRFRPFALTAAELPPPAGRPRILLTLGTFPHPGAARRLRTAAAAAAGLDAETVVVLGHADRGTEDRGWPASVLVTPFVNLTIEVPRCALIIHQGGAGVSWTALADGVPAVCMPQDFDQFRNAGLVAATGAAVVVPPEIDTVPALHAVFEQAIGDPALAAAAERVRAANDRLPDTAALADDIETAAGHRARGG